jgi:thioredoxin-related protein
MEKTAKKIEVAANVAIIIVALVVVLFFIKNYRTNRAESRAQISTGTKFALKDVNWQDSGKSVVLALSTTCHFCTESAGFYRELVQECQKQHVHTVAVLPQAVNEATSYLKNEGVTVDEVKQGSFPELQISGTPTLLLLDSRGVVKNVWFGKLPDNKEREVLSKLGS